MWSWMGRVLIHPAVVFIVLSALFGIPIILLSPPIQGPDEDKHFLRAYGISQGEIVPRTSDARGHKGIFLPARLAEDLHFFQTAHERVGQPGFSYRTVVEEFERLRNARPVGGKGTRPLVFVPYEGSEGYSPAGYLPYVVAALAARLTGLDFAQTIYAMRYAGWAAMTALVAYAIAAAPYLRWAFLLIGLLPAALYARSMISLDGSVLGLGMVVTALSVRMVQSGNDGRLLERTIWMTLCILSKPTQIAFALLGSMTNSLAAPRRYVRRALAVVLPGLVLSPLWVRAIGGDIGIWRLFDATGVPADHFDATRKLWLMLEQPLHFPRAVLAELGNGFELWRQLIGILGWLDVPLRPLVYPLLSVLLIGTWLGRLDLDRGARIQIAVISCLTAAALSLLIFLAFYLTYTPLEEVRIWGVQGRYFIVVLPLVALFCAAVVKWGLPERAIMAMAIAGSLVSGAACIDAIVRADW